MLLLVKDDKVDEEKVECFTKLMSTIGDSLETQSNRLMDGGKPDSHEKLQQCWKTVQTMASGTSVSNRIKFMLQDLIEMKEKGWVQRRKEETAKTISQIHKEAAKEAKRSTSSGNLRKHGSSNNLRQKPTIDADGFEQVPSGGFGRSKSLGNFASQSSLHRASKKPEQGVSRSKSASSGAFSAFAESKNASMGGRKSSMRREKSEGSSLPNLDEKKESNVPRIVYKSPEECGNKAKDNLKEFFVGGDLDDAVLTFHELIGAGNEGSVDRGSKVIEGSVLMVLEMKAEDVAKMMRVVSRCYEEKKIESASFASGLNDPLEFLNDIAIDAPLAIPHLVSIVADFIGMGALTLDFLLNSPEYFRTDGNAAQFAAKVVKKLGGDAVGDSANLEVIGNLMTEDDKKETPSATDLISSC